MRWTAKSVFFGMVGLDEVFQTMRRRDALLRRFRRHPPKKIPTTLPIASGADVLEKAIVA